MTESRLFDSLPYRYLTAKLFAFAATAVTAAAVAHLCLEKVLAVALTSSIVQECIVAPGNNKSTNRCK